MRKKIVAGNWKMNKNTAEALELAQGLKGLVADVNGVEVVICPPFTLLAEVKKAIAGSNIKLGAQNMHTEEKGAFTGEISPLMLKDVGVEYVILGHSERREYFKETNEFINKKVKTAIKFGMTPILCVGEKLEEREAGITEKVVKDHVVGGFMDISKEDAAKVVVAYEPVWAIGTGKTASPEQAQEVHAFIRKLLEELYDKETAENITIQYGGSMNDANAKELMAKVDIDGGLIGGASLIADKFAVVVKSGI